MDTSDFLSLEKPSPKQKDSLGVKMKPKRGKSSQKQKKRLALKLDKVRLEPGIGKMLALHTLMLKLFMGLASHCWL